MRVSGIEVSGDVDSRETMLSCEQMVNQETRNAKHRLKSLQSPCSSPLVV